MASSAFGPQSAMRSRLRLTAAAPGFFSVLIITILLCACPVRGQSLSIAFYNVENLYDTIPSLFYDDSDYTPQGRRTWNTERYNNKLANIARVIGELSPDVLGLAEVENEQVVRDLVTALGGGYNYVHHTGGDRRGMDLALLYRGDRFIPDRSGLERSGVTREFLYISGELAGIPVVVVVCHLPSRLNNAPYRRRAMKSLHAFVSRLADEGKRVIVAGDFNASPIEKTMRRELGLDNGILCAPLAHDARCGHGSYLYNGRWRMYDNVLLCGFGHGPLRYSSCGVYIKTYLLDNRPTSRKGYPLRTFDGFSYAGGYSDHLPVYVILEPHPE